MVQLPLPPPQQLLLLPPQHQLLQLYKLVSTFPIKLTIVQLKILFVAAEVSAQATALANLAETVIEEGLKNSLTGVVSTITDLSSSLAGLETLLSGRRVKRETISNHQKYLS